MKEKFKLPKLPFNVSFYGMLMIPYIALSLTMSGVQKCYNECVIYPNIQEKYTWVLNEPDSIKEKAADDYVAKFKENPCVPESMVQYQKDIFLKAVK